MQLTVYKCDQCKKEIGAVAHFTLNFCGNGNTTGVAKPPKTAANTANHWKVSTFPRAWIHLHFGCVSKYFEKLAKEAGV